MNNELQLPTSIANFVKAVNEHNSSDFLAVFAENAIIIDEGHKYKGINSIKSWNDEKNIGAMITLKPLKLNERDDKSILTAEVDGNFDKTGLPDPFIMDLHFTIKNNQILSLSYHFVGE